MSEEFSYISTENPKKWPIIIIYYRTLSEKLIFINSILKQFTQAFPTTQAYCHHNISI